MAKKILISSTNTYELRVALIDNISLYDLDIEVIGRCKKKGNIYKGYVVKIEPSLNAAFINYGDSKNGFLSIREILPDINDDNSDIIINDILSINDEIIIQVEKEERAGKGAALTNFITLAGCYLVLMPNNPKPRGISRQIEGEDRQDIQDKLKKLNIPNGMGVIVRTSGINKSIEELEFDLNILLNHWNLIKKVSNEKKAPFLIYKENNIMIRLIRDHLRPDIDEIIVDNLNLFKIVYDHIKMMRPDFINKVVFYNDSIPLFSKYNIENQISSIFKYKLDLISGGSIVINYTEALTAIDINSAKSTKWCDIEETALQINIEASNEIAKQLRLRDLGGLIVIDFIDMNSIKNQKIVENSLKNALNLDRARVQIGKISKFGLLEMSRQRLKPSINEYNEVLCPKCDGKGNIHCIEAFALILLRVLEEEIIKNLTNQIQIEFSMDIGLYIINEKRKNIAKLEYNYNIQILLLPNPDLISPEYRILKVKDNYISKIPSYNLISKLSVFEALVYGKNNTDSDPMIKLENLSNEFSYKYSNRNIIVRFFNKLFKYFKY